MYNSIDLDRFNPAGPRADLDALAGLPPLGAGGIRVGLVATFARWKGHRVFLDALARLRGRANVRGYIVGDSIYETDASQYSREQLRAQAEALGLGDTVGFTGKVDDVSAVLRALDIAVHASTEPEPFGLVIAEAMACGRPVVVSRAGGAAEIARGRCGVPRAREQRPACRRAWPSSRAIPRAVPRSASKGARSALRLFSRDRLRDTLDSGVRGAGAKHAHTMSDASGILNLGSGRRKIGGAVNVDISDQVDADVVHDLSVMPWPLPSDTFREVHAQDVVEHLSDTVRVMEEIYRVCRNGARVHITVPHFSSANAYTDPTHRRLFSYFSFDYFDADHAFGFYSAARFKRTRAQIVFYPIDCEQDRASRREPLAPRIRAAVGMDLSGLVSVSRSRVIK